MAARQGRTTPQRSQSCSGSGCLSAAYPRPGIRQTARRRRGQAGGPAGSAGRAPRQAARRVATGKKGSLRLATFTLGRRLETAAIGRARRAETALSRADWRKAARDRGSRKGPGKATDKARQPFGWRLPPAGWPARDRIAGAARAGSRRSSSRHCRRSCSGGSVSGWRPGRNVRSAAGCSGTGSRPELGSGISVRWHPGSGARLGIAAGVEVAATNGGRGLPHGWRAKERAAAAGSKIPGGAPDHQPRREFRQCRSYQPCAAGLAQPAEDGRTPSIRQKSGGIGSAGFRIPSVSDASAFCPAGVPVNHSFSHAGCATELATPRIRKKGPKIPPGRGPFLLCGVRRLPGNRLPADVACLAAETVLLATTPVSLGNTPPRPLYPCACLPARVVSARDFLPDGACLMRVFR